MQEIIKIIIKIISSLGYGGVAFLMLFESAGIPIPSEIIMPFSGFLVGMGRFNLWLVALAGAIGSVLGSWLLYSIGRYGGRPFVEKYGRYFFYSKKHIEQADGFFKKYGQATTFMGRLLPVVRTYISLPAGIHKVGFFMFTVNSFVGSYIWSLVLAWVGAELGSQWEIIKTYMHPISFAIIAVLFIFILWYMFKSKDSFLKKLNQ